MLVTQERERITLGLEDSPVLTLELVFPVNTTAVGFLYNTLIMSLKGIPNPMDTDHENVHLRQSKAFLAFCQRTAA